VSSWCSDELGRTKSLLSCMDGTSVESHFPHVSGRTIFVSGQAFQKIHICDFTHACSDKPSTCLDRPCFVMWSSLLRSCKVHGNEIVGRRVVKTLMKLEPKNPTVCLQASNLFTSSSFYLSILYFFLSFLLFLLKSEKRLVV
jgi:hypothetical protein